MALPAEIKSCIWMLDPALAWPYTFVARVGAGSVGYRRRHPYWPKLLLLHVGRLDHLVSDPVAFECGRGGQQH
jgi:hypothetical protein